MFSQDTFIKAHFKEALMLATMRTAPYNIAHSSFDNALTGRRSFVPYPPPGVRQITTSGT